MKTKIFTLLVALTALFGIDKIQAQNTGDYRALAPSTVVSTPTTPAVMTATGTSTVTGFTITDAGAGYSGTVVVNVTGKTTAGATKSVSFAANITAAGAISDVQKGAIVYGTNSSFGTSAPNNEKTVTVYPLILATATAQGTNTVTGITVTNAGQGYHGALVKVTGSVSGSAVFAATMDEKGGIASVDINQMVEGPNSGFSGDLTVTVIATSHWANPATWEKYNGSAWVLANANPSYSLTSTGNDVTIPAGVAVMGGTGNTFNCNSLNVQGYFVSNVSVQMIGSGTYPLIDTDLTVSGGLLVTNSGSLQFDDANITGWVCGSSTSYLDMTAGNYKSDEATINNNGTIKGFRMLIHNKCPKLTLTGTPASTPILTGIRSNTAQPTDASNATIATEIVVDQNVNIVGVTTTVLGYLTLENTTPYYSTNGLTKPKTLTINSGKTVTLDANSVFHYTKDRTMMGAAATTTFPSTEEWNYNINGTLDASAAVTNLCTNMNDNYGSAQHNKLTFNIGTNGKFIVGDYVRVHQGQASGSWLIVNNNGTIQYNGTIYNNALCALGGTRTLTNTYGTSGTEVTNSLIPGENKNVIFTNASTISGTNSFAINGNLNLNGTLSLGSNNLVIGSVGSIANVSATNFIVTDGTGKLTQSVAANTEKLFPVGASTGSFDPVTVKPTVATDFSVKVGTVLSGTPESSKIQYNAKEWDLTPTTPSSTVVSLTPSVISVTGTFPIFGHYETDKYVNKLATLTGNTYTTTVSSFSPYVTGSSDVATAVENTAQNGINVYSNNGQLFVTNINVGDEINVFAMNGAKVKSIVANDNSVVFAMNAGVYLLDVKSISNSAHTRIKTAVK